MPQFVIDTTIPHWGQFRYLTTPLLSYTIVSKARPPLMKTAKVDYSCNKGLGLKGLIEYIKRKSRLIEKSNRIFTV